MRRREFMLMLAAGTAVVTGACTAPSQDGAAPATTGSPSPTPSPTPTASPTPTPSPTPTRDPLFLQDGPPPLPGPQPLDGSPLFGLPEAVGNTVALTIDDGVSTEVVDAYIDFAIASGVRLTFFVTGCYPST